MLRLIFVLGIIFIGTIFAALGPFYALLFYLWNAYFRPESWTYGGFILSLNLSFIIATYLIIRTVLTLPAPQLNSRTILLLLFGGQCVMSTITSEQYLESYAFLVEFAKVLLISYLFVVLVTDRRKYRLTLMVMALSLGFEAAKQGWAGLWFAPGAVNNNPIPFLGDNNGVALGMMMLVPIFGALAKTSTSRAEKYLHQFFGLGVFIRGIATYSRGGFLAAAALGLFMLARSQRKFRTAIGIAVTATLILSVMPDSFWARMQTIRASDEDRDDSAAARLHFWRIGAVMGEAKPFTGVGPAAYNASYDTYNDDDRWTGLRSAHSTWFGVLGDLGYTGLLLFVGNLLFALWTCIRISRASRRDPAKQELRIYADAIIMSLAAFSVAGTFLSSQYTEMIWHFIGLSTALHVIHRSEVRVTAPAAAVPVRTGRFAAQRPA